MKKIILIFIFLSAPLLADSLHDNILSLTETCYSYGYTIAKSTNDCMMFAVNVVNKTNIQNTNIRIISFRLINNACLVGLADRISGNNRWNKLKALIDLYFGDK